MKELKIGEYSKPVNLGNAFLIIKVENTKNEKIKIDKKKEFKKIIQYEQNRQLNKFSKIYYNKVKINTSISEL